MSKNNKLTTKQRMWLRCYIDQGSDTFGNATQAAIDAYNLDPETQYDSAKQIGWENLTKLDLEINELMDEMGLSDAKLLTKLIELLEAKKPFGKNNQLFSDNSTQGKALELALKLKNKLSGKPEVRKRRIVEPLVMCDIKPRPMEP